jgi:hypothetical protein
VKAAAPRTKQMLMSAPTVELNFQILI